MNKIKIYEYNLNKAYDYLKFTAENNGFYSPIRQKVCQIVYDKEQRNIKNLELAIKYLERRFKEQGLEVFLESPICHAVFSSEEWANKWSDKTVVILASGKTQKEEIDEEC
jgi:hypothetical protein